MNTSLQQKEKKNILGFICDFSKNAKRNGWISHYDRDNDSFVLRSPSLSESARKKYINDEFAFYINDKDNIEGMFIEYFTSNFIAHHKDLKPFIKKMGFRSKKSLIELRRAETSEMIPKLESVLLNSLIKSDSKIKCDA